PAVRAGPEPVMRRTGLHDGVGLAGLTGFFTVEKEVITTAPFRVLKGFPEVPVGKWHAVVLVEQADIHGERLKNLVEPVAFGTERLCHHLELSGALLNTAL